MRCLSDAGVPANVAQLVYGVPDSVSRHLIASPIIRKVSFTGSIPVGKHLMRLAADVAEESAKLTALQTQQQFAVQAFSAGSQNAQSLLRLLG